MSKLDSFRIDLDGAESDHALRYLAASLVAHWDDLPDGMRAQIYELAISGKILGVPHTVQLKQQIDRVLCRNTKGHDDA